MNDIDRSPISAEELAAARAYAVVIEWSEEDGLFIVTVPDIRGLRTHGATREEAAAMGEEAITVWLSADKGMGQASPEPRFTARDDAIYRHEAVAVPSRS